MRTIPKDRSILLIALVLCFILIYGSSGIYLSPADAQGLPLGATQFKKCDMMQFNIYSLNISGQTYPVNYQITGAKLNNITPDIRDAALLVNISPISNGILTIELPRSLIDSKKQVGLDDHYVVFEKSRHMTSNEIKNNAQVRTLEINFDKTDKNIRIDGNRMELVLTPDHHKTQIYSPKVSVTCLTQSPPSDLAVQITANVTDKFGKIQETTLHYSIGCSPISCQDADWQPIKMNLMWGNLSNGTFSATIPAVLQGNTEVNYFVDVKDDLGYSSTTKIRNFITMSDRFSSPTMTGWYYDTQSGTLYVEIIDSGIGVNVKNVSLDGHIRMQITDGDKWDGVYKAGLPENSPERSSKCQDCSLLVYDLLGNHTNEILRSVKKSDTMIHGGFKIDISPEPNISNLTALTKFFVKGAFPSRGIPDTANSSIKVVNQEVNRSSYDNYFELPIIIDNAPTRTQHQLYPNPLSMFRSNNNTNFPLKLFGDPKLFPFDSYYVNMVLGIPFKNIAIQNIRPSFSSIFNSSWNAGLSNSSINIRNIGIQNNTAGINLGPTKTLYVFPNSSGIANGSGMVDPKGNFTFVNARIDFARSSSTYVIIIPLLVIFYLLGAIFILENIGDQLTIRVTITLGVFAFLFAFIPIVTPIKPSTSAPTVFDSLITLALIATIAFTVSSVVGSRPFIKNRFGEDAVWIDIISYILVSLIVLSFFVFNNYQYSTVGLILTIVLGGLGYGLLSRMILRRKRKRTSLENDVDINLDL
jgi:hypothetical protein